MKSPSLSPSVSGVLGHKFDDVHLFAGHEATPVSTMQQLHSSQRKRARGSPSTSRHVRGTHKTTRRQAQGVLAAVEAEHGDAHAVADARGVLESELRHERDAPGEERKCTTEFEDRLAFFELEVTPSFHVGE